jgi:CO dehydrogenase/acetyl-CoA synthase gamma subunit (corrinoid Fe-S protein)
MFYANLYTERINLARYLTKDECLQAGVNGPEELAERLREGALLPEDCLFLSPQKRYALALAVKAGETLPQVPSIQFPRPVAPNLFELNEPDAGAPVLVTGNSEFTLTVLTGLLALTVSPFYLLLVDCRGDTVDMAMVYASFTAEHLNYALTNHDLAGKVSHNRLIIPGFCASLKEDLARETGWEITVGPVCAAELPLFLGDAWQGLHS